MIVGTLKPEAVLSTRTSPTPHTLLVIENAKRLADRLSDSEVGACVIKGLSVLGIHQPSLLLGFDGASAMGQRAKAAIADGRYDGIMAALCQKGRVSAEYSLVYNTAFFGMAREYIR